MSKNSKKNFAMKKKLPSKIFRLFLQFLMNFFFAKFLHLHAKEKKNELSKNVCQNSKNRGVQC